MCIVTIVAKSGMTLNSRSGKNEDRKKRLEPPVSSGRRDSLNVDNNLFYVYNGFVQWATADARRDSTLLMMK